MRNLLIYRHFSANAFALMKRLQATEFIVSCQPEDRLTYVASEPSPNILFFFVDDWGRYANVYADPSAPSVNDILKTPNFDRIGREGLVWQGHANPFQTMAKFPDLLRESGYFARRSGKTIDFSMSKLSVEEKDLPIADYQRYVLYISEAKDSDDRKKRTEEVLASMTAVGQWMMRKGHENEPAG